MITSYTYIAFAAYRYIHIPFYTVFTVYNCCTEWAGWAYRHGPDGRRIEAAIRPRPSVGPQPNPPRPAAACQISYSDTLLPKPPKFIKFNKLIEPRARRASPQGHGKSLPDAVKNNDFPSGLEGFRPKPSNYLRPSFTAPSRCTYYFLRYCRSIRNLDGGCEGFGNAFFVIRRSTFSLYRIAIPLLRLKTKNAVRNHRACQHY